AILRCSSRCGTTRPAMPRPFSCSTRSKRRSPRSRRGARRAQATPGPNRPDRIDCREIADRPGRFRMGKPDETMKRWLDPASGTARVGSIYPAPFGAPLAGREKRALGDPLGLTQFGVNLVTLGPGSWSSQRHWHENEDEFIYVVEGEVSLITDEGETVLRPG